MVTLLQLPVSSLLILVRPSGDKELKFFVICFPGALQSERIVCIKKEHYSSLNEDRNEAVFERVIACRYTLFWG